MAILLVLFHHAWIDLPLATAPDLAVLRLARFGWVGVDLFFVLSGFLITGILLDTRDSPHYFRNFYVRRALRIFPLYYAFLAFAFFVAPRLGLVDALEGARLRSAQGWYWSYLTNVLVAREGWEATPWHTGHFWSLAIEEQFYLLWPTLVFLLRRRQLAWLTGGAVVGAVLLRAALLAGGASPIGIYVLLPPRVDTLAMGAWLAIVARSPGGGLSRVTRWASPAVVAGGAVAAALLMGTERFAPEDPLVQLVGYTAVVCLAAGVLVIALTPPSGTAAGMWRHPLLRFFGRYSYCLYVVHFPVILLLQRHVLPPDRLLAVGGVLLPGGVLFTVLVLATSVAVALISWHLLENPFLKLKGRFGG